MKPLQKIFSLFFIVVFILSQSAAQTKIAILYSENSSKAFSFDPNTYLNEYTAWEIFLIQNNIKFDVVYDEDLDSGLEDEFDILIMPKYSVNSDEDFSAIKSFLSSGKSILFANSSFSSSLNQFENNFKNLFGITLINTGLANQINFNQTVIKNPINKLKKTSTFLVSKKNETQFVDLKNSSCSAAGFILGSDESSPISSIVYGSKNSGKFIFTGFGLTDLIGGPEKVVEFESFIVDALGWLDNEVDVFPVMTINEKEKTRLLFVEYNNALNDNFIKALKKNGFYPHIIFQAEGISDKVVFDQFSDTQVILDIRELENKNYTNEEIINQLKLLESNFGFPFKSVLLNPISPTNLVNELKDYGIENFVSFSEKYTDASINDDASLFLTINRSNVITSLSHIEAFYIVPKIDCDEDIESDYLTFLKNHYDDQTIFTDIASLRNKLQLDANLKVDLLQNENKEIVIRNNNFVEVNDIVLYVNMNGFSKATKKGNVLLNHSVDPQNGMIKIFLEKLPPRSEERVILNSGN